MRMTSAMGPVGRTARSRRQGNAASQDMRLDTKTLTPVGATTLTNDHFRHDIVTDGAATTRTLTLPAAGEYIGQDLLVYLKTRTHASDVINFVYTNIVKEDNSTAPTAITFAAANKYCLFRWTGAKWHVIYKDASSYT